HFFFQAEDGIRDLIVTGVQTCALPISIRTITRWTPRRVARPAQRVIVRIVPVELRVIEKQLDTLPVTLVGERLQRVASPRGAVEIGRASCRERVEICGVGGAHEKEMSR